MAALRARFERRPVVVVESSKIVVDCVGTLLQLNFLQRMNGKRSNKIYFHGAKLV